MERNKKWFSFVEIIIVISILILLWFVVMKISGDSKQKTINATIESQLSNLWVALNSEITEKKELSLPNGTLNYFNKEWWYSHENFSDKDSESIWVYGVLSQSNFLSEIPRDPRNNQYYAYGLLKDKQTFEVAWVIKNWADYLAKISSWIPCLIAIAVVRETATAEWTEGIQPVQSALSKSTFQVVIFI